MADILKHPTIDSRSRETQDRLANRIVAEKVVAIQLAEQVTMQLGRLPDETNSESLERARDLCRRTLDKLRTLDIGSPAGNAELDAIVEMLVSTLNLISDDTAATQDYPSKL